MSQHFLENFLGQGSQMIYVSIARAVGNVNTPPPPSASLSFIHYWHTLWPYCLRPSLHFSSNGLCFPVSRNYSIKNHESSRGLPDPPQVILEGGNSLGDSNKPRLFIYICSCATSCAKSWIFLRVLRLFINYKRMFLRREWTRLLKICSEKQQRHFHSSGMPT